MKKLFYLFVLALAAVSCSNSPENSSGPQVLDIEKGLANRELVKLSEYASAINYIPLESSLECMMSGDEFTKIVKSGDRFYFYSEVGDAPVACFNSNGKFQHFIGTQGRAANEFRKYVKDFVINEQTGRMLICDMEGNLLFYDKDGNYMYTASLPENSTGVGSDCSIVHNGNGNYFFIGNFEYKHTLEEIAKEISVDSDNYLIHFNSTGQELSRKSLGTTYRHIQRIAANRMTYKVDQPSLYYSDGLVNIRKTDSIYRYDTAKDTLVCEYILDYGKLQAKGEVGKVKLLPKGTGIYLNTKKFVLFLAMFGKTSFPDMEDKYARSVFLYDKESREIRSLDVDPDYGFAWVDCGFGTMPGAPKSGYAGFVNDLDGGAPFVPRYIKDGKMYQIMDAIRFMDLAEQCKSPAMKKVAASMNEDSNPVLMEVVLK